jgi:hypothetical protein
MKLGIIGQKTKYFQYLFYFIFIFEDMEINKNIILVDCTLNIHLAIQEVTRRVRCSAVAKFAGRDWHFEW